MRDLKMASLTTTQQHILNETADDYEDLENLYRSICLEFSSENYDPSDSQSFYWREAADAVRLAELIDGIQFLVDQRMLSVRFADANSAIVSDDLSYLWRGWFKITDVGRAALKS